MNITIYIKWLNLDITDRDHGQYLNKKKWCTSTSLLSLRTRGGARPPLTGYVCNILYFGMSAANQNKLQSFQNAVLRVVNRSENPFLNA